MLIWGSYKPQDPLDLTQAISCETGKRHWIKDSVSNCGNRESSWTSWWGIPKRDLQET